MTSGSVVSPNLFTKKLSIRPWAVLGISALVFSHFSVPFQHHGQRAAAVSMGSQCVALAAFTMDLILTHEGFYMCTGHL